MEVSERKKILRQVIRKRRKLLTEEEIYKDSVKAFVQLLKTPEYLLCHSIFIYVSCQQEISTFPLIKGAFLDGKLVAVPKVISKHKMEFFKIEDTAELKPGYLGILEPDATQKMVFPDKNSIVILPGMLFDQTGKRMGYGGGFYDTYLKRYRQQENGNIPVLIGYSYDFQLFEKENIPEEYFENGVFPFEEHDQYVDMLVTPSKVIYIDRV